MSTIDTFVPGVPSDVVAGADYVDRLIDVTREGTSSLMHVSGMAANDWAGESYSAYLSVEVQLEAAVNEANTLCYDVFEVLMAYAGQIGRMESDFADMRDEARGRGLRVDGAVIHAPEPATEGTCPDQWQDPEGYAVYQARVDLIVWFNERATEVGARWGELDVWIAEHLVPLVDRLPDPGIAVSLHQMIDDAGWSSVASLSVASTQAHWQMALPDIEQRASELFEEARRLNNHSGNPATEAAREVARAQGLPDSLRGQSRWLDDVARSVRESLQWLPFAGVAIDVVDAGIGLAQGESIVDIAVEYGGGVAAGAVAGVVVSAAGGVGIAGSIMLPATAAIGGSFLASWLYQEVVPLHVREGINDSVEDAWEFFVETQTEHGGAW